jgi:hypothetical protein
MVIQEVIRRIDETGGQFPFLVTFYKADGKVRDMLCVKRNKSRSSTGTAKEGTAFSYSIKQKGIILINELTGYSTTAVQTPVGTHIQLPAIDLHKVRIDNHKLQPKFIKLFSIKSFNGQEVIHE